MSFLDNYEPVEDRLREFWSDHHGGRVVTHLVTPEAMTAGEVIIFKASVYRWFESVDPDATGYAHQRLLEHPPPKRDGKPNVDAPEWTSPWEVAETSAIGRALANLGYATKGKRPSREEISKASASPATLGSPPSGADRGAAVTSTPRDADRGPRDSEQSSSPTGASGAVAPSNSGDRPTTSGGPGSPGTVAGGEGQPVDSGEGTPGPNPPSTERRDKLWMQILEYAGSKAKAVNAVNKTCKASWGIDKAYLIPEEDLELTLTTLLKEAG